ncbi:MAG: hypothetical protein L0I76_12700, partial [Pseudonocardia sp.]|nr:hypothetical protein [Pseudonocardia sp.]
DTDRWGFQPLAWEQNGLPTWSYGHTPAGAGLLTRRQMREAGLAPGGAAPVAQIVWRHRRHEVRALLWDRTELAPKRVATPAQLAAVGLALAARRWCPACARDAGYCIPTSLGVCVDCAFPAADETAGVADVAA